MVFFALLSVLALLVVAFAVDVGRIVWFRTGLQVLADSAAMEIATSVEVPQTYTVGAGLRPIQIELGTWHPESRQFAPATIRGNAVRVRVQAEPSGGQSPRLFLAPLLDRFTFINEASAVATTRPRDITFVVDVSGSMNNDTEPCRTASPTEDAEAQGMRAGWMREIYEDFGYGPFPGELEYVAAPWGIAPTEDAYRELTATGAGPLTGEGIASPYRISPADDELQRKRKAYSAIIDLQIARLMPGVKPAADSTVNYAYWAAYLDYLIAPARSETRGILPPGGDRHRIDGMDDSHTTASDGAARSAFHNRIGYRTYVQFMLDHGRAGKAGGQYTPLSRHSKHCPWHAEETDRGSFDFPPRTRPMHEVRRTLIEAIGMIEDHNRGIVYGELRDRVSIIAFDDLRGGGPAVHQPLTSDYDAAMRIAATLQATSDRDPSSAVEAGLVAAQGHLREPARGGQGRAGAEKLVVLISDGRANLYVGSSSEIDRFLADNPTRAFHGDDSAGRNASLMRAGQMRAEHCRTFAVAMGLEADREFLDRLATFGGTADSGRHLSEILQRIFTHPNVEIVQ